ncbi:MAG: undecaprenyl-diphosphate phosphatase, partial [bacterium]
MSIVHAIILGAVQGLTEFLPVSSSGHLVFLQHLLGFKGPDVLFDTFLHLGTLVAVGAVFRGDLISMGRSLIRCDLGSPGARLFLLIVLGTVPTAVMGFLLRDYFERRFSEAVPAALMLLVTGCLLFVADRVRGERTSASAMGKRDACIVGMVQGVSIVPGLSRSGSTISTGIFLGLE